MRINMQSNSHPASNSKHLSANSPTSEPQTHSSPRVLNCQATSPPSHHQTPSQTSPSSGAARHEDSVLANADSKINHRSLVATDYTTETNSEKFVTSAPNDLCSRTSKSCQTSWEFNDVCSCKIPTTNTSSYDSSKCKQLDETTGTLSASSIHESTQTDEEENKLYPLNVIEEIIKKNLPKGKADKLLDFFKPKSNAGLNERVKATSVKTEEEFPSTSTSQNADATVTSSGDVKKRKSRREMVHLQGGRGRKRRSRTIQTKSRKIRIVNPENLVFSELSIVLERVDDVKPIKLERENSEDGIKEVKIPVKPNTPALKLSKQKSEKHLEGLSGRQLYICGNIGCKITAETRVEFKDHALACDFAPDNRMFKCRHCESNSKDVNRFLKHLKIHGVRRYLCGLCSHRSFILCDVRKHMNNIHHVAAINEVETGPGPDEVGEENVIYTLKPCRKNDERI